jgi:hypothetical protein
MSSTKQAKKFADAQIQAHGTPANAWGENLCVKCFDDQHNHCLKHGCDCLCQKRLAKGKTSFEPSEQLSIEAAGTLEIK